MNTATPGVSGLSAESLVAQVAEEFAAQLDQGERPDIETYLRRYPTLAGPLRDVLSIMLAMRQRDQDTPPESQSAAVSQPSLPPVLGEFCIVREIGRGGMGVVYEAVQESLARRVALKVLPAQAGADATCLARFRREAQAAARLHHTNIVPVFGVSEHEGVHFYAMQYIDGHGLHAQALQLLGFDVVARWGLQAAEALAYAHTQGVLHRDIKPSNLLLDSQGTVWVTDFGLAKILDEENLTQTGDVLGTLRYLAPERLQGQTDARSDVYSLGLTLYELLTNRPAFDAADKHQLLQQLTESTPPRPRQLDRRIPRDLETIVLKAIAKEPERRYQTARDLADDLRRYLDGRPIAARRTSSLEHCWRWCRRNPAVSALTTGVAAALLLGAVVSLTFAIQSSINAANEKSAREQAQTNEQRAKTQETIATQNAAESRRQVCRLAAAHGDHAFRDGDTLLGLLWLAEPLVRDPENPDVEEAARYRLAAYRRARSLPGLTQLITLGQPSQIVAFSPDGRRLLTAGGPGTNEASSLIRVWDTATGEEVLPPLPHHHSITHASFSPDGKRILTASHDYTARVWDAADGRPLTPPLRHSHRVHHAAFSPDGCQVATAAEDGTARVWNALTGEPLTAPLAHSHSVVTWVAFSPDSRRIVTACDDGLGRVWEVSTGQSLLTGLRNRGDPLRCVGFSPDGRRVLAAYAAEAARVWDAATGQPVTPILQHERSVRYTAFSPDGRRLLTASDDETARVWDACTGHPITPPLRHRNSVNHAAFSPDGRWIATASADHTVQLWDAATGEHLSPPLQHQAQVHQVAISPDGRCVATVSYDGKARVWDRGGSPTGAIVLRHGSSVWHAAFSPDGRQVVTAAGNAAQVWERGSGRQITPYLSHTGWVMKTAFSPDGRTVATGSRDRTARVWDASTGQPLTPPLEHGHYVWHVAFSPDGRKLLTASFDSTARLWDLTVSPPSAMILQHQGRVFQGAFSPDGRWVVTVGSERIGRVWDVATGRQLAVTESHAAHLTFVSVDLDGRRFATAGADHRARVWDAATGQPLSHWIQHRGQVVSACFSPDGRRLVTASRDETAQVWDATTGQALAPPMVHRSAVNHAEFSPDGRRIVTASQDATARVWDAASGQPLTPPLVHEADVHHAAFSPDGRSILTASRDGTARLWEVAPDDRPRDDLLQLVRLLHGHRLDDQGALIPLTTSEFRTAWQSLKSKYPQDFSVSPAQAWAWHQREAEASEREKNPASGLFHTLHGQPSWAITTGWPRP